MNSSLVVNAQQEGYASFHFHFQVKKKLMSQTYRVTIGVRPNFGRGLKSAETVSAARSL